LKNSVFEADEKTLAPQTYFHFFHMRGHSMQTEIRYVASAKTMRENDVGFSK